MKVDIPFRLTAWILLVLSCAISVVSLIDEEQKRKDAWPFEVVWSLILISIAGGIAFLMTLIHGVPMFCLEKQRDALNKHHCWELAVIIFVVVAWIMAIPVLMNPEKALAMDENANIQDANLYFASWWGFMLALALFVNHGEDQSTAIAQRLSREWICLALASAVTTMAASHRIDANCGASTDEKEDDKEDNCRSLRTAITLAVFSTAISSAVAIVFLFPSIFERCHKTWILLMVSTVELGIWIVMVALLTFKDGPAKHVGTLFFGTWISTLLALYVCLQHVYKLFHPPTDDSEAQQVNAMGTTKQENTSSELSQPEAQFPDVEMGVGTTQSVKPSDTDVQPSVTRDETISAPEELGSSLTKAESKVESVEPSDMQSVEEGSITTKQTIPKDSVDQRTDVGAEKVVKSKKKSKKKKKKKHKSQNAVGSSTQEEEEIPGQDGNEDESKPVQPSSSINESESHSDDIHNPPDKEMDSSPKNDDAEAKDKLANEESSLNQATSSTTSKDGTTNPFDDNGMGEEEETTENAM